MGFKANANKRRKIAAAAKGPGEKKKMEFEGQVPCDIAECKNWADKKIGGRKIAFDRAADIFGEDSLLGSARRVSVCKSHYREWKKERKDEMTEWS
ncbi:MAG: hypothetical protein CXT72_02885 [Methanobacteriota archaeon]|jgi:hypothetical protein|nr:MAG: hypothetical protein CXT72_02885 [Euryarchaeota archaeon]HIE62955.1 hypothetical protein [Candidatus Poseidoniales archaeon]HIL00124.1 hypothetical protein [Candidatus Poseidoniales archaeon]|tara:strand:- start:538 stop:825 length:288 start_codon:yes stop_codon:yes gene_type:complete